MVPRLLAEPDTEVRLLVRADDEATLRSRVDSLVRFWGYVEKPDARARIMAVRGDATLPRFGLTSEQYDELAMQCTHVIHAAGSVRMNLSLDDARRSAVNSTREIVALAGAMSARGSLQKIEFVSTVGIAGKRAGVLPESWIDEAREFHNTYEQAKAEAEAVVRTAIEAHGLPITVHRPSMVVGDSRDGRTVHFQIFYFICEFLSGRKTFGIYPDLGDVRLDVVPSDLVANALVSASLDPATSGRIFHLSSGPEAPLLETLKKLVVEEFSTHGVRVPRPRRLSRQTFVWLAGAGAILTPPKLRRALETLPVYLDYLADRQSFGNAEFRSWAQRSRIAAKPPLTWLPMVLRNYIQCCYPRK